MNIDSSLPPQVSFLDIMDVQEGSLDFDEDTRILTWQLDGFDETFGSGNFEDDDLCLRTSQAGYALMVDESTIASTI